MPRKRPIPAPNTRPARRAKIRAGVVERTPTDENGATALHDEVGNRRRRTAVWVAAGIETNAAYDADVSGLVRLLRDGADPNQADYDGNTPLHVAADKHNADLTRLLLAAGADPHSKNNDGLFRGLWAWTPLRYAAQFGRPAVVRLLLDAGADPDAVDALGDAPLYGAVQNSKVETVELLLQHHANPHIKNIDGRTALDNVRPEDTRIRELLEEALLPGAARR